MWDWVWVVWRQRGEVVWCASDLFIRTRTWLRKRGGNSLPEQRPWSFPRINHLIEALSCRDISWVQSKAAHHLLWLRHWSVLLLSGHFNQLSSWGGWRLRSLFKLMELLLHVIAHRPESLHVLGIVHLESNCFFGPVMHRTFCVDPVTRHYISCCIWSDTLLIFSR